MPVFSTTGVLIGGATAYSQAETSGWSTEWSLGWGVVGAIGGALNPWTAIGGGIGWFGGYLFIGPSGGAWGSLVGGLGGGFGDARRGMALFSKLPPCANTRPYLLPSLQLGGAGVGGYLGYRATGSWDGALAGANVGMLLGGIGATAYNLLRPCFAAGTPIRTAEGSKPVEEIVAGDHVLSRDENDPDGPVLLKVVEETFVRTGRIWVLRIDGRDIRTTGEHPFYARGKGWTAVAELDTTDELLGEDGRWLPIEILEDTGEYETVYNFRVADFHTYFIGGDGWTWSVWTHNQCRLTELEAEGLTAHKASELPGYLHEVAGAEAHHPVFRYILRGIARVFPIRSHGNAGRLPKQDTLVDLSTDEHRNLHYVWDQMYPLLRNGAGASRRVEAALRAGTYTRGQLLDMLEAFYTTLYRHDNAIHRDLLATIASVRRQIANRMVYHTHPTLPFTGALGS